MWLLRVLTLMGVALCALEALEDITTLTLAARYGYHIEEHVVETSDGYILTMHHMPHSKKNASNESRPVIFLMHGLFCSSAVWTFGDPNAGLAFILVEAGYDVWMGNARGNTYSRKHKRYSPDSKIFWDFSWHEIGLFDIPAMINSVLQMTGAKNLQYVAHSQGATSFFVLGSSDRSLKDKVRSSHLLAPIAWMKHMTSPLARVYGPWYGQASALTDIFGSKEIARTTKTNELLGEVVCKESIVLNQLCTNLLFLVGGWNSPYLNHSVVPDVLATTPSGGSFISIEHYLQEYLSGYFRQRDYGFLVNLVRYDSSSPPIYDVGNIDVPMYLYYSDNDYMASLTDMGTLRDNLNPVYLKRSYRLPQKMFNHIDFVAAGNIKAIIYDRVVEDIRNA